MVNPWRTAPAAALTLLLVAALASGCTSSDADADIAPTGPSWPTALELSADTTEPFWIVWTAVAESSDGVNDELQPAVELLQGAGYDTAPWDPACQTGAQESLAALTGYVAPVGVGIPFATAEEAGNFDTLFDGAPVSVTTGTYTCGA